MQGGGSSRAAGRAAARSRSGAAGVGAGVGFYRPGLLRGERCRAWSLEAQTGRLFPKASSSSARSCGLDAGIPGRSSCQEDKQDHIRPGTFSPPTRAPGSRVCSGGAGPDGARLGVRLPGRAGPNLALPRAALPGLHLRHGQDKTGSAPPGCPRGSPHPWRYVPGTDTPRDHGEAPRGAPSSGCPPAGSRPPSVDGATRQVGSPHKIPQGRTTPGLPHARACSPSPQPCGGEEGENSSQTELPAVRGSPVAAAPSLPLAPLPPTHSARLGSLGCLPCR